MTLTNWLNLSENQPWNKKPKKRKTITLVETHYKRGSRHNKIGMWLMWLFYIVVIIQVVYALSVIPFWPITATIISGLMFCLYVALRAGRGD
jgi:hypothetical protein